MTMLLTCGFMVDGLGRARACACAEMKMGKKSPVVTYICLSKMRLMLDGVATPSDGKHLCGRLGRARARNKWHDRNL